MSQNRKIEIPLKTSEDEVLELEIANLPPHEETISILRDQDCKITLWIQVATEYYRQGNFDAFEAILSDCLDKFWNAQRVKQVLSDYPDADRDRIKALDLLAIFYVRRGNLEKNREQRREYLARAAHKFTEVDKLELMVSKHGSEYQFHLLGRAYCCLLEGRTDQADKQFTFVLQQQQQSGEPEIVPSLLGRACIEFNKKEANGKKAALSFYKKALQVCPTCPADVRLGIGICCYKLGMLEKAEEAFLKTITLDDKCVGALLGLAVLELNKKTVASIKKGVGYVSQAYKINPSDPMALTLLADHLFYLNRHPEAIKLATRALENTDNDAMQAQACYQLARVYHKQENYDSAFEYYYKATQNGGTMFSLAHHGLGQMYIHRKEYESAIQSFETVLKSSPDNLETLKILASLYSTSTSQSKKDLAKAYLKKVTDKNPNDLEAWVETGALVETFDTQAALHAYNTALKIYESNKQKAPAEVYNNIAALLFSTDQFKQAEIYYKEAIKICEEGIATNEIHYGSIIYTIRYNMARLYEVQYELGKAEQAYKGILTEHPMYLDCWLRLGCMERDKGMLYNASDRFKEIFRVDQDYPDAWILIGNLHLSKQEWGPGQKKFDRVLQYTKQNPDLYSLISVGNVWLQAQYNQASNPKDQDKLNQQRGRSLAFYKNALKLDPKNIYAASGIGCILAAKGMFNEARDVFSQVREATADFPDVWVNIAHIYVEQKQFVAAVQMYENCLKKFYNNANTDILMYIARALFKAEKLRECKKVILRARYICPYDMTILFNLAKVLKTLSRQVFSDNKSTFNDVVTAEYELKLAQEYFKYYKEKMGQDRNAIDLQLVRREEKECADLIFQVQTTVKMDAEQRDREELQKKKDQEEKKARELAKKAEEEQKRIEADKRKKEEQENIRKELLKKQEEQRVKQKMMGDDTGIINDGSEDEEGRPKRKKKKTMKEPKQKRERDRDRDKRSGERDKEGNKKFKSRALLSSDSSSSDDEQLSSIKPPLDADLGPTIRSLETDDESE